MMLSAFVRTADHDGAHGLWTVSYTHLDVYKRQHEGLVEMGVFSGSECQL